MANFNAGAIEGTLTLDRSPFDRDLKEAIAKARAFEKEKIKVALEIVDQEELTYLQERLQQLQNESVSIDVDVDDSTVNRLEKRLKAIQDETVTIEIDVDDAAIAALRAELKAIPDEKVTVEVDVDGGGAGGAASAFMSSARALDATRFAIAGVIALLPTLTAAIAASAAVVGGLVATLSTLTVGLGIFALAAVPAWKAYTKAVKAAKGDMSKLSPQMRALKEEQNNLNRALKGMDSNNRIYAVFGGALRLVANIVRAMRPVITTVTRAISDLVTQLLIWSQSPALKAVTAFINTEFTPTFKLFTGIIGNLITMIGGLVVAFQPFGKEMLAGLKGFTKQWSDWANGLSKSKKFEDFLAFVRDTGPKVLELFKEVGRALINIGKSLAPIAGPVTDGLIALFKGIGDMDTTALGTLIVMLGTASVAFIAVAAAAGIFNLVMAANPISLIIVAIAALVAGFIYLWKTNEGFRNFWINLWATIKTAVSATINWITGTAVPAVVAAFNWVKNAVQSVGDFFVSVWNTIKNAVSTAINFVQMIIMTVFNAIKSFLLTILGALQAAWGAFWGVFGGVITAALKLIKAVWDLAWAWIAANARGVWKGITTVVKAAIDVVKSYINLGLAVIKAVWNTVWGGIKSYTQGIWNDIKLVVSIAVNALKAPVTAATNAVKAKVSEVWNNIKATTSSVWGALSGIVGTAISKVFGVVSAIQGKIQGIFSGAGKWLWNAGRDIIQGLLGGLESLMDSVTSKLEWLTAHIPKVKGPEEKDKKLLRPAGQMIMGGLIDEIDQGIATVLNQLSGLTGDIPSMLELEQTMKLMPTVGPAAAGLAQSQGISKDDFIAAMAELIQEIRKNTQPLIGNYNDAHQSPQEIAEAWWFTSKGRG